MHVGIWENGYVCAKCSDRLPNIMSHRGSGGPWESADPASGGPCEWWTPRVGDPNHFTGP